MMTSKIRTLLAAVLLLATAASAQSPAPAIWHYEVDGEHVLVACVPDEAVDRFARAGFDLTGGPVVVLCVDGYTPMYKLLGR